ncbi:DUF1284 domain-containing protein [Asaccharospora irregularis]|uniref:DUF1284 domain-containing protein n=1 Tax=Asaccharospora irregularis DSM 2635 TaxID=1121321 RepID=A0A1M5SWD0_9FIRM|nr:DUF1284 domain-containing protein [Asaccharospora irregularis]SHH42806.1 hypothetical protein SAMN04488530_1482 [Asaccharospora irregularis DSM 2635]
MLEIRPHHILCMRAYQGKGYSEEFSKNMESIIKKIDVYNKNYNKSNNQNLFSLRKRHKKVKIIFSLDSLCGKCPNNIGSNLCSSQERVEQLDKKVSDYFNIKEGIYVYKELEDMVYKNMTEEIFDDICKNCAWYHITNCKDYML